MIRRLPDLWLEHPAGDYLITGVAAVCLLQFEGHGLVAPADRAVFYQTLAGVSGGLLGLGAISVTVVFTVAPTERLQMVLNLVGQRLRWLIFSSLCGLVLTTAGSLALFALDGSSHRIRVVLTAACITFMGLRFGRLWWLFNLTLKTLVRRSPTPEPKESWNHPDVRDDDYAMPKVSVGRGGLEQNEGSETMTGD